MDEEKPLIEDSTTTVNDPEPPDNGAWYICCCRWCASMYDRFDTSFVNYFAVYQFGHGLWIMIKLAAQAYYKDRLNLDPGDV